MPSTVVPLADFRTRYPEFDGVADAVVNVYIDDAEQDTSATFFGDWHPRALAALAAHRLSTFLDASGNATGGQGGALAAASADGVSATYEMPTDLSAADVLLWGTTYGQLYLEIRNRCGVGVLVAG